MTPPFTLAGGGWNQLGGKKRGLGFDRCCVFPYHIVCILVARLSQLDSHLSFSDVGKRHWSDKDLRFGCEQTSECTERGAVRFDYISSYFSKG